MKDKIIETSIKLFDKKGYTATSIKDIVEKMDVTKGTFYYYFSSKQDLLRDIHLDYIENLISQQEDILRNTDKDCTEKLYGIIHMVISNIGTKRESARIFFREMRHLSEKHIEEITNKRNLFRKNYQQLIETGISLGEFKSSIPPDMLTFGILGITNWSYYWYNPEGNIDEEELARIYTDIILNGVKSIKKAGITL
ncbi:TetR family transcriptional regulator [Mesobacillus campisalis]|uniref:TetR family transcriptional regulator n=1 Tax=Mesobacillus campisalis TaxID=1408103 RepID=A0A0M2SZ05_9BACI|nr:TetR/AcrR family transcriptional regulator [Mesobacillus campisalis]KKK37830.1 TetR family transcriptional regulator [Mesobacillus campisalis]